MEEASCKKAAYVSNYLENIDDITVIQGPAARVRPKRLPDEFFSCKRTDHHTSLYLRVSSTIDTCVSQQLIFIY